MAVDVVLVLVVVVILSVDRWAFCLRMSQTARSVLFCRVYVTLCLSRPNEINQTAASGDPSKRGFEREPGHDLSGRRLRRRRRHRRRRRRRRVEFHRHDF